MKRKRRMRRAKRSNLSDIPLTPLIDTALTLLIIFMLTTPIMHTSLKVSLPSTQAGSDTSDAQEVMVHIDQQGAISVNGNLCTLDQFDSELSVLMTGNEPKTVFVHADKGVDYGSVVRVVDHIKMVEGVSYVALASTQST